MYILKLKAVGDYNRTYYVNLACSNETKFIISVKNALNNFCASLDGVDTGVLMSRYFGDVMFEKSFNDFVLPLMEYQRAHELFVKIQDACQNNYVYLCSGNFELENVMSLLI